MSVITIKKVKVTVPEWLARQHGAPRIMEGEIVRETARAILFRGRVHFNGTHCGVCGTLLTNPASVAYGIGPICAAKFGVTLPDPSNLTEAEIAAYRSKVMDKQIEAWLPKSKIEIEIIGTETMDAPAETQTEQKEAPTMRTFKTARLVDGKIRIEFSYDPDTLFLVKQIPGRRFHADTTPKHWTAPVTKEAVDLLKSGGFDIDRAILDLFAPKANRYADVKPIEIEGLRPFQAVAVGFIQSRNGRAIIADEQGLGKTVEALGWLRINPDKRPAIIVVPASLKLNWAREARKWIPDAQVQILSGERPHSLYGDIIIINYDILAAWLETLKAYNPQVIILDEAHYVKNNSAMRTKAAKALCKGVPHVIAMSGTPIVNRPAESYNMIKLVNPNLFPNWFEFARRYCNARLTPYGWDVSGASNTEELHQILTSTIMIRRTKAEVLQELPEKTRNMISLELSNRTEYDRAERDVIEWLRDKDPEAASRAEKAEHLARINHLKKLAVEGKLNAAIDWIRNFIESGEKLIVFAHHKFVIDRIMQEFGKIAVKVDGSVSMEERQAAVDRFQTDPACLLFVGNIRAAGVGLTLTAASNVAFVELPWTPGELEQAEDRCHRIGQKNAVTIYYLLAADTIDEEIAQVLDEKRAILASVLDGRTVDEESTLVALIRRIKENKVDEDR